MSTVSHQYNPPVFLITILAFFVTTGFAVSQTFSPWTTDNQHLRALSVSTDSIRLPLNLYSLDRLERDRIPDFEHEMRSSALSVSSALPGGFDLFDLETHTSFNSKYPWGGNDTDWWQGVGINVATSFGGRYQWQYGSITVAPLVTFIQNAHFDLVPAAASFSSPFSYFVSRIDAPQRYGDDPLFDVWPGQSEIRFDYRNATIGFGTQSWWIGPTERNAIILSNNAGGFPKLDLGLRPAQTRIGTFEGAFFWGRASESDYFDDDSGNDERLIQGMTVSYAPVFLSGLTLGIHRTVLSYWNNADLEDVLVLFNPNPANNDFGFDARDQRFSITMSWKFPSVGFEAYAEWARNDYSGWQYWLLVPEHTHAFSIGFRKTWGHSPSAFWLLNMEVTELIESRDYEINGLGLNQSGFYNHSQVSQGYTHNGQILGALAGTGADNQYLSLRRYTPWGYFGGFIERRSYNKDYIYGDIVDPDNDINRLNVELTTAVSAGLHIDAVRIEASLAHMRRLNWNYIQDNDVSNFYAIVSTSLMLD